MRGRVLTQVLQLLLAGWLLGILALGVLVLCLSGYRSHPPVAPA